MRAKSWLYVIGGKGDGPVKVGYAANRFTRLASLQTGNPEHLYLIDSVPGDKAAERTLHQLLKPWQVSREWFSCDDLIRHFFDALREHMLDRATDRMGPDWTPDQPGMDEHYHADCATPEDIRAVWKGTKRFFDYIWAGGDAEEYTDPDDDDEIDA